MKAFKSYLRPAANTAQDTPMVQQRPSKVVHSSAMPASRPSIQASSHYPSSRRNSDVSLAASRRSSTCSFRYPEGDFRNMGEEMLAAVKAEMMVQYLHRKQEEQMWLDGYSEEGVILKQSRQVFISHPYELSARRDGLYDAVAKLNVKVAMTLNTNMIRVFLRQDTHPYIILDNGLHLQIIPSVSHLPACQKHHFAAFIQDTGTLVVWDDDPTKIIVHASKIEKQLLAVVTSALIGEKPRSSLTKNRHSMSKSALVTEKEIDRPSEEFIAEGPRKTALQHSVIYAFTLALLIAAIGGGARQIAVEVMTDHTMLRLAFVAVIPLQMWLGLFFMQSIVVCFAEMIGPISQVEKNTKYYSGVAPPRNRPDDAPLPHVTIQCPVFKEGLHTVIAPTVRSLKAAISTYEMQGGSANIFINDDGMQLISEDAAQLRRDFYEENNIGWVARPKHNADVSSGDPVFVRGGRFKKASNMNHALAVSVRVEEKLAGLQRMNNWCVQDEANAYQSCLDDIIREEDCRTWADGNIRVGDYILIVDSDTRVPADCLLDSVTEMELSPEVAVIQFPSGVLNITNRYFENGIAFFTKLVYTVITFIVACGDIPPFVGHNALLRWSALQDVAIQPDASPKSPNQSLFEHYWSENTVSEDFELAIRLQTAGYRMRLAGYCGTEFKEGVSLTVYDELARWKKYAFGCSEIIFHPLKYWLVRGPFTPLFRRFVSSGIPLPSKLSIIAYIGTYYAIGSAYLLVTANYFLTGWYYQNLDHYYIQSFEILFSIILVFSGLGNIALAILRYRTGEKALLSSLWENFKWIFLLYVFFGGVSMHVSEAILSHMFGINISWGATSKEVEDTTFFKEIPKLLRRFKVMFIFCLLLSGGMIYLAKFAPLFWRINIFTAIFPLAAVVVTHVALPIALNPSLMLFTW
ncbi:hypothetical protein MMC25_003427 [Agyrium rufum]|nr:hypothetical protein [Agyrium rufum]